MKKPSPEFEIKYLIYSEHQTDFSKLYAGDVDRLIEYYQATYPAPFKEILCSPQLGQQLYNKIQQGMYYRDAIRAVLVELTCLEITFNEILNRIQKEA